MPKLKNAIPETILTGENIVFETKPYVNTPIPISNKNTAIVLIVIICYLLLIIKFLQYTKCDCVFCCILIKEFIPLKTIVQNYTS